MLPSSSIFSEYKFIFIINRLVNVVDAYIVSKISFGSNFFQYRAKQIVLITFF
jgi:hypothetical protein